MSGLLWGALIIPGLLAAVLLIWYRKETKWWELMIPAVVTIITIALCQWLAVRSATRDHEYWGHMTTAAVHEEPLSYDGQCSETYACGQT